MLSRAAYQPLLLLQALKEEMQVAFLISFGLLGHPHLLLHWLFLILGIFMTLASVNIPASPLYSCYPQPTSEQQTHPSAGICHITCSALCISWMWTHSFLISFDIPYLSASQLKTWVRLSIISICIPKSPDSWRHLCVFSHISLSGPLIHLPLFWQWETQPQLHYLELHKAAA